MTQYADTSILMGMTDRGMRTAVARGDAHGQAVLAALLREHQGNPPGPIDGGTFRHSNTTQLEGEMLLCQRAPIEQTMVIDGGWGGCLARTPQGEILLIDSGLKVMARSRDEGRTWTEPAPLPPPVSHFNNLGALGALRDGTLLIAGMKGGDLFKNPDQVGPPIDGAICRSMDNGKTWSDPFILDRLGYHVQEPASHLRIVELRDGTILLPVAGNTTRSVSNFFYPDGTMLPPSGGLVRPGFQDHDQWIFRSRDGGRTWGDPSLLAPWGSETNLVELPSGTLIATIRYQREWAVEGDDARVIAASRPPTDPGFCCTIFIDTFVSESADGGYTWSEPRKASRYLEHPSDIVRLSDGTLVMVMGHKAHPHGPSAVWSHDDGRTWSEEFLWLHMDSRGAAGQPSALALPDDTVLVSYDRFTWDPASVAKDPKNPVRRYQLWVSRFKLPSTVRRDKP